MKIKTVEIDGKKYKLEAKTLQLTELKFLDATKEDGTKAEAEGTFEAYVSVFGNVDSYGEIVDKGAFTQWLKDWFPRYPKCVLNHDWTQPVAKILEISEDEIGLKVKAQLLLELERAKETYILMKEGVLTDFSFGFSVEEDYVDPATNFRHLKKMAVWEVSPVLVGANRKATLSNIKSMDGEEDETEEETPANPEKDGEEKKGAVLSKANKAKVQAAITALTDLLEACEPDEAAAPAPAIKKAIKVIFN